MAELDNNDGFFWGKSKESTDETRTFYYSFVNDGLEYALYDNVEIYDENKLKPHIGKIMKLWEERGSGKKQVLIRWYFKAVELPQLNSDENSKEVFLAFGKGKGVINVNDLDVIYGKCKVLCTSQDPQNRQPSENDLKSADYFFSSVYNVDRGQLSAVQRVADKLGYDVVFNKPEWITEGIKTEDNLGRLSEINDDGSSVRCSTEVNASTKEEIPSTGTGSGSLPSESKKRPRELEVMPQAQKKRFVQQTEKQSPAGALKRGNSNIDETSKNKKLKVLDKGKTTSPKEGLAKPEGTSIVSPDSSMNSVKVKEEANNGDRSPKKQKVSPQTEMVQGKLQASKTEKPSTPKDHSTASTGNLKNSPAHSPKPAKDEVRNKAGLKSSMLGLSVQSKKKPSEIEKFSLPGDTFSKSPVSLTTGKNSSNVDNVLDAIACLSDGELPADEKKTNKMAEEVSGNSPRADGNDVNASPEIKEVSLVKRNNLENRKIGDVSKSEQDISHLVNVEGTSSEKRRLVKVTESSRIVQSSTAKKEEEGRSKNAHTDQEGGASENKTLKQQKFIASLKSEKGKVNLTGISSDTNIVKKKLKGVAGDDAPKKLHVTSDSVKVETNLEKRRIFKELPWEENLRQGLPHGRVVLVQNFEPLVTSVEVRDMMKSIFKGFADARVIPHDNFNSYGEALVIFENKGSADTALQAIESKCLVLSNSKRPLIASRASAPESSRISKFPGHLLLEKYKLARAFQSEDVRRAVATSHCSQPNTIEFEMAIEWRLLQEVTQLCRGELLKMHRKEIEAGKRMNIKKS